MLDDARTVERTPERTQEDRRAQVALEASMELRQLTDEVMAINNDPERNLRDDLVPDQPLTETVAARIADKVIDERMEKAAELTRNAQYYVFNKRDAEKNERFEMPAHYNVEHEVPFVQNGIRLEYVRMADENDLIRAEVDSTDHRKIMDDGVPLESRSGRAVFGLAPPGLENEKGDGQSKIAVYKRTASNPIKDFDLDHD